jgi:hypothetical protein
MARVIVVARVRADRVGARLVSARAAGADELLTSVAQGVDGSPLGFYLRLRLPDTGELSTAGESYDCP